MIHFALYPMNFQWYPSILRNIPMTSLTSVFLAILLIYSTTPRQTCFSRGWNHIVGAIQWGNGTTVGSMVKSALESSLLIVISHYINLIESPSKHMNPHSLTMKSHIKKSPWLNVIKSWNHHINKLMWLKVIKNHHWIIIESPWNPHSHGFPPLKSWLGAALLSSSLFFRLSSPKTLILALCLASASCALAMRAVSRSFFGWSIWQING